MKARVAVNHAFQVDGEWITGAEAEIAEGLARELEAKGYVDVLSVEGKVEVWPPCCNGCNDH